MKYNQLCYSIYAAHECGIDKPPYQQMLDLGYKIIACVPQTLYDAMWFTVEDYIEPLPEYLSKMQYDFDYWHKK